MIVCTFHGPSQWSPNHDESTIEVFNNLGEVTTSLFERHHATRPVPVRYLNGNHGTANFISEPDCYFRCWVMDSITLPPTDQPLREDDIVEALILVHGDTPDYTYTLVAPDQITVQMRG